MAPKKVASLSKKLSKQKEKLKNLSLESKELKMYLKCNGAF